MYHKRLRTYKKIGFEVCTEVLDKQIITNSIFGSDNYRVAFEKDILSAAKSIVISSPFLGSKSTNWLIDQADNLQTRGVWIYVISLSSDRYPEDGREHHMELLQYLRGAGIHILTPLHCYERFAIIDQSIVWYGSMNLLSNAKVDDNLMRITSSSISQELLELTYTKNKE